MMVLLNSLKCRSEFEEQLQQGMVKKFVLSDIAKNHRKVVNADKMTIKNPILIIMLGNGIHGNQYQQYVIHNMDSVPNAKEMAEPKACQTVGMTKVLSEVKGRKVPLDREIFQFLFT